MVSILIELNEEWLPLESLILACSFCATNSVPGTGKNRFFDFRSILKSEHGDSILAQIVFRRFDLIEIDFSDFFNYYSNHSSIQRNMICPSRVSHCNVERLASRDFRTERSSMDFCAFCLWEESLAHVGCGSYESRVHIIVITFRCFLLFLHIPSTFPDFNASELAISVGGNCLLESLSFSFFTALLSAELEFNSRFLFLQCCSLITALWKCWNLTRSEFELNRGLVSGYISIKYSK